MGTNPPDSMSMVHLKRDFRISRGISESIHLPEELITEILVRVPVKSLLRFKCVSKPWLSLITNPQFISSHFSKSCSSSHLQLLYATETCMEMCSLYSAFNEADPFKQFYGIDIPALKKKPIIGIINGLVCLNLKGTDLCVWNPALNKIKHLNFYPKAPFGHFPFVDYLFSFGYEESTDDYKVVCLQAVARYDFEVRIYSLKAESWRRIDLSKRFYLPHPGVFAYGKIYWSAHLFMTPNSKYVSLDMSSDKFAELQPPEYDAGKRTVMMGVSGGQPFVLCDYYEGRKADLWVLNKRGVEETWCILVSIPYYVVNLQSEDCFNYRCLCISSNGEIVFGKKSGLYPKSGLLVYNWKKKEYRKIKLVVYIASNWRLAAYVESLVWPD